MRHTRTQKTQGTQWGTMEEEGGFVFSLLAAVGVLAGMAWAGAEVSDSEEASAVFCAWDDVREATQRHGRGVGRFLRAMAVVWAATVVAMFAPGDGVGGLA